MSTGQKPKTKFALGDYVEVSERIAAWFEAYPDGRIETEIVTMTDKLVVTKSRCYRTQDTSELPAGIGHSMLGIPGKTPYTKDSELENCETSSVGRALVMAGIPSKQIASGHEIRNKRVEPSQSDRPTANGHAKQVATEHNMETGAELAERQRVEDTQIDAILAQIETHKGYREALQNLYDGEIMRVYKGGSGRLKGLIKSKVAPVFEAAMPKDEPATQTA